MTKFLIRLSLLIIFITACDKESDDIVIPSTVILQIETMEEGGVEVIANFQDFNDNDELGFRIFGIGGSQEFKLTSPEDGRNSIRITTGLFRDQIYSCQAYIKRGDIIFSSRSKEFYATSGSYIPNINSIAPSIGFIGDLIEINYSEKIPGLRMEDLNIKLGKTEAEIVDIIDDQKIIFRVPNFLSPFDQYTWASLSITYLDKVVPNDYEFNLKAPIIENISPRMIDFGGEIIVKGLFFKEGYPAQVYLELNDIPVTMVTKVTSSEVRFNVSIHHLENRPKIELWSNYRNVVESNIFDFYPPEIESFQTGRIGDEIEIIGKHFYPAQYVNKVFFDAYEAEIISGEATKLVVKVPRVNYSDNEAILKVSTTNELVSEGKVFVFE